MHPSHETIENAKSMPGWSTLLEKLLKNSGTVKEWVVDYIQDVSSSLSSLSQIITYWEKNILHLQTHSDLLPLWFSFSHQNYVRFLTQHHVELTNLSITKALVLELVSAEINFQLLLGIWSLGPLNSINAENDFIINTHLLAKHLLAD